MGLKCDYISGMAVNSQFPANSSTGGLWQISEIKLLYSALQGVDIQAIVDDIRKLKIIVKGHERRIKSLEEQLALYDTAAQHQPEYP